MRPVRRIKPHALALPSIALCVPQIASASPLERLALHFDAGAGTVLTPEIRRAGFDAALHTDARLAVRIVGPLTVHTGASLWVFPTQTTPASIVAPVFGVGVDLPVVRGLRAIAGAEGGVAVSGGLAHAMFGASLSLQIDVTPSFAFGPYAQYARVFARAPETPADANLWSAGLAVSFRSGHHERVRARTAPPPSLLDDDGDGIANARDRCPRVAAGRTPDPERAGCPDGDIDRDGVVDHLDSCRIDPAGPRPDPVWRGCPVADADEDGVPDVSDTCRLQPAGRTPDHAWPGCPARDADHDGILDDDDQCIETARGDDPDPERAGCPDGDTDHDGVPDHHDECRTVAVGLRVDPSRRGCPLPDGDHDGVPDVEDHCPTTAGAPNADPRRNGCIGAVRLDDATITTARPIRFTASTPILTPPSIAALRDIATFLAANPGIHRVAIRIVLPASLSTDTARANALHDARIQMVRYTLVSNGVEPARIVTNDAVDAAAGSVSPSPTARGSDVELRIVDPPITTTH